MAEEITIRESRRVKAALQMARLATIKTLSGFDFSFQPSLDRNRILALAQLDFVDRREVVHFIGQSGTGKSHLAAALGVEAIRAGIRRAHPPTQERLNQVHTPIPFRLNFFCSLLRSGVELAITGFSLIWLSLRGRNNHMRRRIGN